MVGVGRISAQIVAANDALAAKVQLILFIIISLNIFVGLFNLLPLLPLDGGHLAVIWYERVRAWLARLRGRPDPGLVDMRKLMPGERRGVRVAGGIRVAADHRRYHQPVKFVQ